MSKKFLLTLQTQLSKLHTHSGIDLLKLTEKCDILLVERIGDYYFDKENSILKKVNSIHFGGQMLGTGILIGAVIPGLVWIFTRSILFPLIIVGIVIIAAFVIVMIIEAYQDNDKTPSYAKRMKEQTPFDPEKQYAVIRCSICTGEKVAGFRRKDDGHFTDVMVIRTKEDEQRFKTAYNLETIKKEY